MMLRRYRNRRVSVVEDNSTASVSEKPEYKKSDIQRMNLENLKVVSAELGIEVTEESKGTELKELIIEKLGL